jgi:hypothetical protein
MRPRRNNTYLHNGVPILRGHHAAAAVDDAFLCIVHHAEHDAEGGAQLRQEDAKENVEKLAIKLVLFAHAPNVPNERVGGAASTATTQK